MTPARPQESTEDKPESKISVVSEHERDPQGLVRGLFSLGTEKINLIDNALKGLGYGVLEDMISEKYFENINEISRAALAHLVMDIKYAVNLEERKKIAQKIATLIEEMGLME